MLSTTDFNMTTLWPGSSRGVTSRNPAAAAARIQSAVERIDLIRLRVRLLRAGKGKELGHSVVTVLGILAVALIEFAPQTTRNIGDDAVQNLSTLFIPVEVVVDVCPQVASGLGTTIGICIANALDGWYDSIRTGRRRRLTGLSAYRTR